MTEETLPLACPRCAQPHPLSERFCSTCGMPLVYAPGVGQRKPITEQHRKVRKIKPQYAEGDLVRVAGSRNLAEAEFIQGMLLEEGVPSLVRRTAGFDVPDFLAGGPRDVLVPVSGAEAAREILLQAEVLRDGPPSPPIVSPLPLAAGLLAGLAVIGAVVLLFA